ncbi:MAG TPA: hypothetical protein VMW64_00575 [Dehalococcoidia bacterium]|nr:hypothetical protein [Dehalococcoidia bacterium]
MFTMTVESHVPAFIAQLQRVQDSMKAELSVQGKEINRLYNQTSNTWKAQPRFMQKVEMNSKQDSVTVWAEDRIYWFVHEGVSVMRAVLTNPYVARTAPGVLSSRTGSGERLYASKKINKKSYKPRKFTQAIIKRIEPGFKKRMQSAMLKGVKSYVGF